MDLLQSVIWLEVEGRMQEVGKPFFFDSFEMSCQWVGWNRLAVNTVGCIAVVTAVCFVQTRENGWRWLWFRSKSGPKSSFSSSRSNRGSKHHFL